MFIKNGSCSAGEGIISDGTQNFIMKPNVEM
jgi:hypothetical protein